MGDGHDFDFQMRIWGWSVWSKERARDGLRNPALTFERHEELGSRWWDLREIDLRHQELWREGRRVETPRWWALAASSYMTEAPA